MPENKKPVKQVSVYNGTNWDTHDIGANAENITLSSIGVGSDVQTAFDILIGSNTLGGRQIVITDPDQHITTNSYSINLLEDLENTTVIENQGTLDNNASIKKLKQKSTDNIILPETKTSAVYMPNNITTLDGYLGNTDISGSGKSTISGIIGGTDISSIGDGTITGAIGSTDISSIGDGTVTGAINTLNTDFNTLSTDFIDVKKIKHTVRNFLLSSGGSAQLTFSDGTPITYPKYNVIQCHTASTSSGGNTITLPITVYNNTFWISGRDTVNWNIVTNRNVSVDIVYYQI